MGKAVDAMCFSPCFVHVTREAFVQRQLLQCQTCGSQAFHVLDCCRSPDYVQVSTSHLGKHVKAWLGGVREMMWMWLFQRRQRCNQPVSREILDAWETRPFTISKCETLQAPPATDPKEAVEEVEHETVLAHR
jgi:hypothetical protein